MGRTSSITMPSMVGIVGRAPAVDEKVWCFFFYVTLSNYEVCDNGNAMKQCNFQNNYGTIAQRKVSSCAPVFKFFYGTSGYFLRGKFIPKIAIFSDFGGHRATFLKPQWWKLEWLWRPGRPSPTPNFVKIDIRGYTPLGKIYTNNYHFSDFGSCKPAFSKPQMWNLAPDLGLPPPSQIL